jgi:hypothetical protein
MKFQLFSRSKLRIKELKLRAKRLKLQHKEREQDTRGLKGQTKELRELEDTLTPLEIAALLRQPKYRELPFMIAASLSRRPPARYIRYPISQTVNFYSGNCGAPDFLVAFCGGSRRLMMPISYFLQSIQDDVYDVLLLADWSKRHFEGGLPGYSSSLLGTLRSIQSFARVKEYRRVITYGTSMGGLPALRAGLWLDADRAISVGGRFCWHPARLTDPRHEMPAFDFLCDCRPHQRQVQVIAVFSKRNELDAKHYAVLKRILPDCMAIAFDTDYHSPYRGLGEHELESFFAKLFGGKLGAELTADCPSLGIISPLSQ